MLICLKKLATHITKSSFSNFVFFFFQQLIFRQPDFCLVCFDVENMTSVSMNVEGVVEITDPEVG